MDRLAQKFADAKPDIFGCVSLNLAGVQVPDDQLRRLGQLLQAQTDRWRATQGVRSVACSLGLDASASLIGPLGAAGFQFHHAAGAACLMLLWLAPGPCNYPPYATHTVGCAGLVIDPESGRLLVVTEFYDTEKRHWKLPGGYAELGEEIGDAAKREVKEETGLDCNFVSLVSFRHLHGFRWGISDLYFVCLLNPLPGSQVSLDAGGEIADSRWVDPAEFAADAATSPTVRLIVRAYLRQRDSGQHIAGVEYLGLGRNKRSQLYCPADSSGTGLDG